MHELQLGRLRQGRLWLDELPDACFQGDATDGAAFPATAGQSAARPVQAGLEFSFVSGFTNYALLGGTFEPNGGGRLLVRLQLTTSPGPLFAASVVGKSDSVRVGFPTEFAPAIEACDPGKFDFPLPSGTLDLHCAAHAQVGSSTRTFRIVFRNLVTAITLAASGGPVDEVVEAVTARLSAPSLGRY